MCWVTEDSQWDHEWTTVTKVTVKENFILEALHYDIDVSCPLQWALLWFAARTNLNRKFVNNGTKVAQFRDTANSAIELTCNIAFDAVATTTENKKNADSPCSAISRFPALSSSPSFCSLRFFSRRISWVSGKRLVWRGSNSPLSPIPCWNYSKTHVSLPDLCSSCRTAVILSSPSRPYFTSLNLIFRPNRST